MEYMTFQAIGTSDEKEVIRKHVKKVDKMFTLWMREAILAKLAAEGVKLTETPTQHVTESGKS